MASDPPQAESFTYWLNRFLSLRKAQRKQEADLARLDAMISSMMAEDTRDGL